MENGLKVCVVTLVKRGRYDDETMHVHHVIAKPAPHVIAKPGPHTSLRSPSGLWQSFPLLLVHVIAKPVRAVAIFIMVWVMIVLQIATSLRSSQ